MFVACLLAQYNQKLGSGAYKQVWLGYDADSGKEVAWNTVSTTATVAVEPVLVSHLALERCVF